jgi:hypothetical protein
MTKVTKTRVLSTFVNHLHNSSLYSILNTADLMPYNTPANPDIQAGAVSLAENR